MSEAEDKERGAVAAEAVVGVVGSAANTGSIEHFLTHLPPQDSAAVVVVLQHREALDEDQFRRALAGAGHVPISIEDDAPIEAGKVYLAPAQVIVTVEGGRFRMRPTTEVAGRRGTIDSFLVSLAIDEDGKTIVVALAGTDGKGALGLQAAKEAGGLTLAEQTEEARAGDLAMSSSPAALADAVLPIGELAEHVSPLLRRRDGRTGPPLRRHRFGYSGRARQHRRGPAQQHGARLPRLQTGHLPAPRPAPDAGRGEREHPGLCRDPARAAGRGAGPLQ